MVNIEKEACPEKKDFLWRKKKKKISDSLLKTGKTSWKKHTHSFPSLCSYWFSHQPGLLNFTLAASAGVVSDVPH